MKIIIILLYICSLIMILKDATILNYGMYKSFRWVRENQKGKEKFTESFTSDQELPYIYIILSVLREQVIIKKTVDYLLNMEYPLEKLKIFIVTTERELAEGKANEVTTIDLADNIMREVNKKYNAVIIECIHFPKIDGRKAHQANYAFNKIYENYKNLAEQCYIAMYDADSYPDQKSLAYIGKMAANHYKQENTYPPVIQQPGIYLSNFNHVNTYMQLEGLAETRWAFGYEIYNMLSQQKRKASILRRLVYCVGHGVFIRMSTLKSIGGFPCPYEDVPLGNRLSMVGVTIKPIPLLDYSEVAWSVSSLIKQSAVWFGGGYQIFQDIKFISNRSDRVTGLRFATLVLHGVYVMLTWFHYMIHLLSLICMILVYQQYELGYLSIGAMYLDYGLGTAIILSHMKEVAAWVNDHAIRISFSKKVYFTLISPIRGLVRGLGPIIFFKNKLKTKIFKKQYLYYKTERPGI